MPRPRRPMASVVPAMPPPTIRTRSTRCIAPPPLSRRGAIVNETRPGWAGRGHQGDGLAHRVPRLVGLRAASEAARRRDVDLPAGKPLDPLQQRTVGVEI